MEVAYTAEEEDNNILLERRRRESLLVGKYIVITNSKKNVPLFIQDTDIGKGYWTKYLSNARGFIDVSQAIIKANNLELGKPRVCVVLKYGRLEEVYRSE